MNDCCREKFASGFRRLRNLIIEYCKLHPEDTPAVTRLWWYIVDNLHLELWARELYEGDQ